MSMGALIDQQDYLVRPEGFNIPYDAEKIHGISTALAEERGLPLTEVLEKFNKACAGAKFIVGQNVGFDVNIIGAEFHRTGMENTLQTCRFWIPVPKKRPYCANCPVGRGGKFKLPTLTELHEHLFGEPFSEAHNATADVEATTRCFLELLRRRHYTKEQLQVARIILSNFLETNPEQFAPIGLKHINLKKGLQKNCGSTLGQGYRTGLAGGNQGEPENFGIRTICAPSQPFPIFGIAVDHRYQRSDTLHGRKSNEGGGPYRPCQYDGGVSFRERGESTQCGGHRKEYHCGRIMGKRRPNRKSPRFWAVNFSSVTTIPIRTPRTMATRS